MSEKFFQLEQKHIAFIEQQHMYFVGTAGAEGFVNVSPKGRDSFRVVDEKKVVWLNLTGSGNESAAHVLENKRMTIMFCSFGQRPLILRIYGQATVVHSHDAQWQELLTLFPDNAGARQFFQLDISMVQTSCGYAVPFYEHQGDRDVLKTWAENKGQDGIEAYWKENNVSSLDGKATGILKP